jgi:UDP-2,3-diacylglucosamine pyrophosphatase LpxH
MEFFMAGKLKIVISDLHLGASTSLNPLTGFQADAEFASLLETIQAESDQIGKEVELILNGDTFEFLLLPVVEHFDADTAYLPDAYRDSSAEASLKRLELIVRSHPKVFSALTSFLHLNDPVRRITIIKGDHDPHLYWPQVKSKLRELLGTTGERSSLLLFAEEFINREGVYIEHGHQHAQQMNVYPNFRLPIDGRDRAQLYYPPGARVSIQCLSQVEDRHWWARQIKPFTCTIWYALQWDFELAARLITDFMRIVPGARADNINPNINRSLDYLRAQLEDEVDCQVLAQNYAASSEGRKMLHQQILALTENARLLAEYYPPYPNHVSPDPLVMAQIEQQAGQIALKARAEALLKDGTATLFIFGHTHEPRFERLADDAACINTGAWLWTQYAHVPPPLSWQQVLQSLETQTYSLRLPYAYIEYDETDRPQAQLRDYAGHGFERESAQNGRFLQTLKERIRRIFGEGGSEE